MVQRKISAMEPAPKDGYKWGLVTKTSQSEPSGKHIRLAAVRLARANLEFTIDGAKLLEKIFDKIEIYQLPRLTAFAGAGKLPKSGLPRKAIAKQKIIPTENYKAIMNSQIGEYIELHDKSSGVNFYPAFQFSNGEIHRNIPPVVNALREPPRRMSDWQILVWYVSPNTWLDRVSPMDILEDKEALLDAVSHVQERIAD